MEENKDQMINNPANHLESIFIQNSSQKHLPIIKPNIAISKLKNLFTSIYPILNTNLQDINILLNSLHSLFMDYPPLIQLLHSNLEKGFLFKQLILLSIHLINNIDTFKHNEHFNQLITQIKQLIQLCIKYYDCPRQYYDLIYKQIASMTLWKKDGFDEVSFPSEVFQYYIELLLSLYGSSDNPNNVSRIFPKTYITMNGNSSITFKSNTVNTIPLKNRVFISWFCISDYISNEEDPSILEIVLKPLKSKTKKDDSQEIKTLGIYINKETNKMYFKCGETILYLPGGDSLKPNNWYLIKFSFVNGALYLFDNFNTKTYSLLTKQNIEEDININDIILYKHYYGVTTSSFIIKLPSNDVLPPRIFPGIDEAKSDQERLNINKENKLYRKFYKYGIVNYKVKDYFFSKIKNNDIQFDLFICPFQIYYNEQGILVFEHNEIIGSFKKYNNSDLNYFNICEFNYDLKRIHLLGGVNVFLPLFEIVISSKDKYLEKEDLICSLLELIANVIGKGKYNFIDAIKTKFFYCLGIFLESINKTIYTNKFWGKFIWIKQCFEGLCETFSDDIKDNICKYNSYYKKILFNPKFFGKFDFSVLSSFFNNVTQNIEQYEDSNNSSLMKQTILSAINIKAILYYILKIDKKKYSIYCCNEHKNMLKNSNEKILVSDPSFMEIFLMFKDIIIKVITIEILEKGNNQCENIKMLIGCLGLDISPCLQVFILLVLDELFEKVALKKNDKLNNCVKDIKLNDLFVFVLCTSHFMVRMKVMEFIDKYNERLLLRCNFTFTDEHLLVMGLCLKPNLSKSIQKGNENDNNMKENDNVIFNEEFKMEENIFKKAYIIENIEEKKFFEFEEDFLFFNVHPEIREELYDENNYCQQCSDFIKSIYFLRDRKWFESIVLFLSTLDKLITQKEFIKFLYNCNYTVDILKSEYFLFLALDVIFREHNNPDRDNNYASIISVVQYILKGYYVDDHFYQKFLKWFVYHFTIINAIQDEYKEIKEEKMKILIQFFEENILKLFFKDIKYFLNSPEHTEVLSYFLSIFYDFVFTLKHTMDFIYKDEEICHLTLSEKKEKIVLFEKHSDKIDKENLFKMKENFIFDIPNFINVFNENKLTCIENILFPFCKHIFLQLQLNDLSNVKDIENSIKNFYEYLKRTPKKQDCSSIINIFNLLFYPPHYIKEDKMKNETKIEQTINLEQYQFTEGCRVITTSLFYYIKYHQDKSRKLIACNLARDFIIYISGYIIKYLWHKQVFENYYIDSDVFNLVRNSIFILFKSILQELYPINMSNEYNNEENNKIKDYIASLIYFYELANHHNKCKEFNFMFAAFSNIEKEEKCPIKLNELNPKKKVNMEMILTIIKDKNDAKDDTFWNFLLSSVPYVNDNNEVNYFQKNKIAHNARKLIYDIQYIIPIIPLDLDHVDKTKLDMLSIHYETNYISFKNYYKLKEFQSNIINQNHKELSILNDYKKELSNKRKRTIKLYKSIKKRLFSFRNAWSNQNLFYEEQDKIKYKIVNHYGNDLSQCLLTPIIDTNLYLPNFKYFSHENLFSEEQPIINLNINSLFTKRKIASLNENTNTTYLFDLYKNFTNINTIKTNIQNDKTNVYYLCLVKKTHHIRCMFDIKKQKQSIRFEFIYNSQGTGIDKNDILYDKENDTCYGSFLYNYPKDIYKIILKISFDEFAFYLDKKYFYKDAIEIFTTNNKSYLFHGNTNAISQLKSFIHEKIPLNPIKLKSKDSNNIGYIGNHISLKYFSEYNNKCICFVDILNDWKENKISSFHFLLICNLFGGRSYNDLTQYPVFPWTLNTYSGNCINYEKDLRNFDYPMGKISNQNSNRFETYQKKYDYMMEKQSNKSVSLDNNNEKIISLEDIDKEPFFYAHHYSNVNYISKLLSRIFPFTFINIEFQGNNIEQTYTFLSIPEIYNNLTSFKNNVEELIPEFFNFPEIFRNINKLKINNNPNVELPKWANNRSYEFIIKHRMSLESDECQKMLHHWFDLIFGYKQIGEHAKHAHNVFMNHTYWGKIVIKEDNRDELDSNNEMWINYYLRAAEGGLTPRQLVKDEHTNKLIKKKEYKMLEKINTQTDKWFCIDQPLTIDSIIYCYYNKVKHNRLYVLTKSMKVHKLEITYEKSSFFHIRKTYNLNEYINKNKKFNFHKLSSKYKIDINKRIITINSWDKSIHDLDFSSNHIKAQIVPCKEDNSLITCFNLGFDNTFAIIGTQKGSLIIYDLSIETSKKKNFLKRSSKSTHKRKWKCMHVINDHHSEITALSIKEELNIFASSDKEGFVNIYTIPTFKLIRSFKLKYYTEYIFISDSPLPCIVTFANKEFQSFTINGSCIHIDDFEKVLLRCPIREDESQQEDIKTFCYYRQHNWKEMLIVATTYGHLQLREFPEMKIKQSIPIPDYKQDDVSGLVVVNEKSIVVFTRKGKIHLFTDEK